MLIYLNELISLINDELLKGTAWFQSNKLLQSLDKTNFIIFHPKRKSLQTKIPNIKINDMEILQQIVTKFLGIIIDQNLN